MTRGRPPRQGLDDACRVATARGTVMSFVKNRENRCDFMIVGNGDLVFVQVRKARRVGTTREEMEREFCEPVMRLRSLPSSVSLTRELWTYTRYGVWRFFRIDDTAIVEICQDGNPLKNPFVGVARTKRAVGVKKPGSALRKVS
ncbi:MAG TPA: hypothetical protein VN227_01035 [Methanoregula sp.]|nr:hypothetical protein [Methanoregula sp.]